VEGRWREAPTMSLSDAFDQYVLPALAEYHAAEVALSADQPEAELLVRRRSRPAAVELHQFADRVFDARPTWLPAVKEVKDVRDWLASTLTGVAVADVGLVGDVADGFKHVTLTRKSAQTQGEASSTVRSMGYGRGVYGAGKYGGGPQMVITTNDGRERQLSSILLHVANGWLAVLGRPSIKSLADSG
jgi:hypothetical protein